jgi:carboxymethylenebutenolidase
MTEREITTQSVQIHNGDLAIDAYLAAPQEEGAFPAVIVIQEIFGVNDHIRDITRRFARQGYVAIAPAIYQRQAPGFETGYTAEAIEIGRIYKNQTQATELLSDIQAAINYLYSLPQVKPNGVGCIGFCFGGHVAYLVAVLPEIKATASFYGAGIATLSPGGGEPTIARTKDIKGTLYAFFGMEDASIPAAEVAQIESELKKWGISQRIFRYPRTDHGFFCDQRASYNPKAAEDAWSHVLELFSSILN